MTAFKAFRLSHPLVTLLPVPVLGDFPLIGSSRLSMEMVAHCADHLQNLDYTIGRRATQEQTPNIVIVENKEALFRQD
jgi:hypothetical protein